jgi:NAD-dependent DNA ligase
MAKTYVLKEPDYLRQQALEAVALLRYMRFFSDGKEISPIEEEAAARYDSILEQILQGVPLRQIVELQEIFEELRQAQERRRAFREYKKRLQAFSIVLATQNRLPKRSEVIELLALIQSCPLLTTASTTELGSLIQLFRCHPHLTPDEYTHCRYIRHLLATDFADGFYLAKLYAWLRIRYTGATAEIKLSDGYALDFPNIIVVSGSVFCFTGKFAFGSRKKCREAVALRGGTWITSVSGSVDFLVVARDGENTSATSTKVSACLDLKSRGHPCFMLTEEIWLKHLDADRSMTNNLAPASFQDTG